MTIAQNGPAWRSTTKPDAACVKCDGLLWSTPSGTWECRKCGAALESNLAYTMAEVTSEIHRANGLATLLFEAQRAILDLQARVAELERLSEPAYNGRCHDDE